MHRAGVVRSLLVAVAISGWWSAASAEPRADDAYWAAMDAFRLGDYLATIELAERAAEADPRMGKAWELDGHARLALGDLRGAMTVYRYALDLVPDYPELEETLRALGADGVAARLPEGTVRSFRPALWGFAGFGRLPALVSLEVFRNVSSRWAFGAAVGHSWAHRAFAAGAFVNAYTAEGTWAPFFAAGAYEVVQFDRTAAPGFMLGSGFERRGWNGATMQIGFFIHAYYASRSEAFAYVDPRPERIWNTWVWPGITMGFSR